MCGVCIVEKIVEGPVDQSHDLIDGPVMTDDAHRASLPDRAYR